MVAKGVAEHSGFEVDPFARLKATLDASYTIVFGSRARAEQTAAVIDAVHQRVRGEGYAATDPALLLWVHATLVDTALRVHNRFLGGLSPADANDYYRQSMTVAELLGVPLHMQPEDFEAFRLYVRGMVGSLIVTDEARQLATSILHPRLPWVAEPFVEVARQVTVGLLPLPLRRQYGLSWDRPRQAALLTAGMLARQIVPRMPGSLRRVA
jgi:uncharacterized protein (DUF2236 family)